MKTKKLCETLLDRYFRRVYEELGPESIGDAEELLTFEMLDMVALDLGYWGNLDWYEDAFRQKVLSMPAKEFVDRVNRGLCRKALWYVAEEEAERNGTTVIRLRRAEPPTGHTLPGGSGR